MDRVLDLPEKRDFVAPGFAMLLRELPVLIRSRDRITLYKGVSVERVQLALVLLDLEPAKRAECP